MRQQLYEQGLLDVQPIFRLLEDEALRPVHDRRGDLLAAVRGETVHRDGIRSGCGHQRVVDAVGDEGVAPFLRLGFLAHGGPRVGVHDVGARHELERVAPEHQAPAEPGRAPGGARDDRLVGARNQSDAASRISIPDAAPSSASEW